MGLFWFKAVYTMQHIKSLILRIARGCMAASFICSRGRLQERFTAGAIRHMTAGVFYPAESVMP